MMLVGTSLLMAGCHGSGAKADRSAAPVVSIDAEARAEAGTVGHGKYYGNRIRQIVKELETRKPGGLVLLGDSITQQFPGPDIFPGAEPFNQGIGGDSVPGVIDRLDLVEAAKPSRLYLMIGCNDHHYGTGPLEELRAKYWVLAEGLRKAAPDADVTMLSVLPMGAALEDKNQSIRDTNAMLPEVAKKSGFEFIDLTPWFADASGNLREDFTPDGVHLTARGYEAWMEAILPDEDLFAGMEAFAPRWRKFHSPTRTANKIDPSMLGSKFAGNRGENELVVYTPAYGKPSTGTNAFGSEAVVENGRVTAVLGGDSPIPSNGFVVSGHGESAAWVVCNLRVGRAVTLKDNEVTYRNRNVADLTPRERVEALVGRLLMALPTEAPLASKDRKLATEAALELRKARASAAEPTEELLAELENKVVAVENIARPKK